jgi:AraC-like DNA-binding protein
MLSSVYLSGTTRKRFPDCETICRAVGGLDTEAAMTHWASSAEPHYPQELAGAGNSPSVDGLEKGRNYGMHVRGVERVIRAMMQCLDRPMHNDEMADIACQSPFHFNRVFHRLTGVPPIQFHYALRLQQAKRLLISTDLRITDICFDVGYGSLGTFVTRFNALVGMSPTSFRRSARQLASRDFEEFRYPLLALRGFAAPRSSTIRGAITSHNGRGVVFSGLFRRGIPEGEPVSCAHSLDATSYAIPAPENGNWFVFSIAVPWTATGMQLLLLDGLARGRSGLISRSDAGYSGDTSVELRPSSPLDPPILTAIPLLMWRRFNELMVHSPLEKLFVPPLAAKVDANALPQRANERQNSNQPSTRPSPPRVHGPAN